jgi:beta-aspartyl-peptidase (threonine type)
VSATGAGEFFIRYTAAADVCARVRYQRVSIAAAAGAVIDRLKSAGGEGGLIAMDANGSIAMPYSTATMSRGWVRSDLAPEVIVESK